MKYIQSVPELRLVNISTVTLYKYDCDLICDHDPVSQKMIMTSPVTKRQSLKAWPWPHLWLRDRAQKHDHDLTCDQDTEPKRMTMTLPLTMTRCPKGWPHLWPWPGVPEDNLGPDAQLTLLSCGQVLTASWPLHAAYRVAKEKIKLSGQTFYM